jgi:PKD repeat protein
VPDFLIAPSSPKQMEQVTFDASDPTLDARIAAYDWTFGDGSSASGRQVAHQFSEPGSFVVTLTITDNTGAHGSRPKTVQVGQTDLPAPDFTFSPTSPGIGEEVFFNGAISTVGEGRSIVSYAWDFGTGRTGSGMVVSKRYDTAGDYTVTLTVKDDVGNTASKSHVVSVKVASPGGLTAAFTVSPSDPAPHTTVTFNASTSTDAGDPIVDYAWDFGDGTRTHASNPNASHAYIIEGSFTVTLTITDSKGRTAMKTQIVAVALPSS